MKVEKTGILSSIDFSEYLIEPDGSVWYPIAFHANADKQVFSSSDTFEEGVYKNSEMWFNAGICKDLTSWEFLWYQQNTNTSSIKKVRWTQSIDPFQATYEDVAPGTVTYNTTTGYTNSPLGGLYKYNSGNYFCAANASKGNWWGIGAWNRHQGGIPAHNTLGVVTTGWVKVYVRVDNQNFSDRKIGIIDTNHFYEI